MNEEVKKYIETSVLCWLASTNADGQPNVSPKEAFTYFEDTIIIANIASPNTVRNIRSNKNVCVSFIDIFVQKGFQIKGEAEIIERGAGNFPELAEPLLAMTEGKYPFHSITQVSVKTTKPIIAPSYILFPERTESEQVASAAKTYGKILLSHNNAQ